MRPKSLPTAASHGWYRCQTVQSTNSVRQAASTENLTRSFFLSLGDTLEKAKLFSRERIGGLLRKYGGIVPKFGGTIKAAGDVLSVTDMKEVRQQVETVIKKHKATIVVFIDDIDRLDRKEIQTLFKLIRLAADFSFLAVHHG